MHTQQRHQGLGHLSKCSTLKLLCLIVSGAFEQRSRGVCFSMELVDLYSWKKFICERNIYWVRVIHGWTTNTSSLLRQTLLTFRIRDEKETSNLNINIKYSQLVVLARRTHGEVREGLSKDVTFDQRPEWWCWASCEESRETLN